MISSALGNRIQYHPTEGHCYTTTTVGGISSDVCYIMAYKVRKQYSVHKTSVKGEKLQK